MANWNEADHPRDEQGKFTDKGGGSSSTTKESYEEKMQRRADILFPNTQDKKRNAQFDYNNIGLGNFNNENLSREDILFPTMSNKKDNRIFIANNENQKDSLSTEVDNSVFSNDTWKKTRIFITGKEDFREKAYKPTPNDVWTIGYGHTEGVKEGDKITRQQAEELYKQDFKKYSSALKNVTVPLNDNEKVALTSFIYNVGQGAFKSSTLLKKLNEGDKEGAANEFSKWVYQKGEKLNGLVDRRKKERELFLTPVD